MHAYVSLCSLHAYKCTKEPVQFIISPGSEVMGDFDLFLYGLLELNSEDLKEQQVLGITKPSLQPQVSLFL